jgi:hypothetical protein
MKRVFVNNARKNVSHVMMREGSMQTPKNKAGEITERIMSNFSKWNEDSIMSLDTGDYNKLYGRIYKILADELGSAATTDTSSKDTQ